MTGMNILALDPGPETTGWVRYEGRCVADHGVFQNDDMLSFLDSWPYFGTTLAIEAISSFGMPVGREVFDTCIWIGRFQQAWRHPDEVRLIYRKDVKIALCGSPRAKDANIRQALIDLFGGKAKAIGKKSAPGPLYGVKTHAWAALGVAVTAAGQGGFSVEAV